MLDPNYVLAGPVGVEMAAQIVALYKNTKKVSLVCRADSLLARCPSQAGKLAGEFLRSKGVDIFLNERADFVRAIQSERLRFADS